MLEVLADCFKRKTESPEWKAKLKQMIPSYGESFIQNPELVSKSRALTKEALNLNY
jgi:malate dehydrogenase (quinone)